MAGCSSAPRVTEGVLQGRGGDGGQAFVPGWPCGVGDECGVCGPGPAPWVSLHAYLWRAAAFAQVGGRPLIAQFLFFL